MNEIGRGAQYKVRSVGTERVRKIPLTTQESEAVIASWYAPNAAPQEELRVASVYVAQSQKTCAIVQTACAKHHNLSALFAHPRFEEAGIYTQDRVTIVAEALQNASHKQACTLVDQYISLTLELWRYGLSERVFNFTVNNGISKSGGIVLVDFGEITTDKAKVLRALTTQRWLRAYSYHSLDSKLKAYYEQSMRQHLTPDALERLWLTV